MELGVLENGQDESISLVETGEVADPQIIRFVLV